MVDEIIDANARTLGYELRWFGAVLDARLRQHFDAEAAPAEIHETTPPELAKEDSVYAQFVQHYGLSFEERLVLVLALVPHVQPQLLDPLLVRHEALDRGFTEFGGLRSQGHNGFLPTGETAMFLLAGTHLARRFALHRLFDGSHFFARHGILSLHRSNADEPLWSGQLCISREYLDYFTTGRSNPPPFSHEFPAKVLQTNECWDDLVVEPEVREQLEEIKSWIRHGETLMKDWGFERRMKPGFRSLFYGPPGTGKTMTASLLGKETGREVYRIDLSMVISKYIGETEKNLAKVFDQAGQRDWILFFDEADALFGKRTNVKDAHDRYANQEVAYLLQRVEEYDGVVILASNLKEHIDEAFTRRFHSIIHFPIPRPQERLRIWENAFNGAVLLEPAIELRRLAPKYEISGGAIMNVVRYASLMSLSRGTNTILLSDLETGVHKELQKEGRSV